MMRPFLLLLFLISGPALSAQDVHSHAILDKLLQTYVSADGKVDYPGLKEQAGDLDAYLLILSDHPPQGSWSRAQQMAYWINAYNAFTLDLILDNYPLKSIRELDGGNPWDVKRIRIGDRQYSLNEIEHKILRPRFGDARIHFAVNCAARSCPPLLNRAWRAASLETDLEKQTRAFVNNPAFNSLKKDTIKVSRIFDWYAADFGDLAAWINRYSTRPVNAGARVEYLDYDWRLNE